MATYAIGDVQGCYDALQRLLAHIQFDPKMDTLWFTGDLVNRGANSLETLRFIKQLGVRHKVVLGNHDLHLLACAGGAHSGWPEDTLSAILIAPDRDELLAWLCKQPLLHYDPDLGFAMVHAGLAASWSIEQAQDLAAEVSVVLQSSAGLEFLKNMYGDMPDAWSDQLEGWERLRCITNYFTRARFCHRDGRLELKNKGKLSSSSLMPWFQVPGRQSADIDIIFGHWAALGGVTHTPHVFALDTGCIWGFCLTAFRLEDKKRFSVPCSS